MSMVGTFDSFTSARLGIYAAQHGLRVTGNNISNINTGGYTRQRVDQYSFKTGANDKYRSLYDNHIGSGALVQGISQIRDPYLDIRYRNISTETYHYDTWLAGLQNIASILDEVGKGEGDHEGDGLIYRAIQDLAEKLRAYSANPTTLNDRLVRDSATSLAALFHNAATRLESLYNETEKEFNENISVVNEILTNIRDLNKSIREAEIHGDTALEMRDERNRQIDALSQYLDIKVEYSYEDIGAGVQVEKLTISLNNANPDSRVHTDESILVDGLYATQLSVPEQKPVLNTREEPYLQGFTYLREVTLEDAEKFLDALNKEKGTAYTAADLIPSLNEDGTPRTDDAGNPLYLIGTNDSDLDGVLMEKNDNYTIQLGQLVNAKGELWKNTTTRWEEITDLERVEYSRWGITVGGDGLNAGANKDFTIFGTACTVVADGTDPVGPNQITESDAHDPTKFAQFVVDHLSDEILSKYSATVGEDGQIIFTALDATNTDPPTLKVTPEGNTVITASQAEDLDPKIGTSPNGIDTSEYPQYKYDEHGNVIQTIDYVQANNKWYKLQVDTEYTHEVVLDDNDLRGILQAERELLTEEGEFSSAKDLAIDENALIKRGIPYYMKSLDLLAQKFAEAYNQLNSGYAYNQDGYYIDREGNVLVLPDADGTPQNISIDGLTAGQAQNLINNGYFLKDEEGYAIDENGKHITDANGDPIKIEELFDENGELTIDSDVYGKLVADLNTWLDTNGYPMGGVLFSNRGDGNDPTGITAANISIAADWSNGVYGLIPTFMMLFTDEGGLTHSTQNDNADHMVAMIEKSLTYNPRDLYGSDAIGPELFNGSFNDMLSNMMAVEGEDADITYVRLSTYATSLTELDYSREGVSGVDLNDEAMNMISYQKAMSAAMRLMTAIDEMLDRLINNTGLAGR